LRPQLSRW